MKSHESSEYHDSFLGYYGIKFSRCGLTFQNHLLPLSSTLQTEQAGYSKMLVPICTLHDIKESRKVLQNYIIMLMSELPIKCKSFSSNDLKTLCVLFTAEDEDVFSQNSDRDGTVSANRNLQKGNYTIKCTFS